MSTSHSIPNLFIVGAPKCGTTALHTYLGEHPEIFMAADKENNHFAKDLLTPDDPFYSDDRYDSMFRSVGGKKIVGESSVYYMLSKVAAENIFHFNPESKIIVMLRNPVDMLQSFHAQLIYNGDEDILDFKSALEAETKRKSGELKIKKTLRFKERLFYSEVVSCSEQIQRYLSLFPKEQVHIIIYDDFKQNTAGVYRKTLEFLNVDPMFRPDFPVINSRKKIPLNNVSRQKGWRGFLQRMLEQPLPPIAIIKKITPDRVRKYLQGVLAGAESANQPGPLYASMDPDTRKQLQNKYCSEIEKLSNLLGRDLNYWCKDDQ